jgi:N-acetyl-anhydromuramyl-L-alanine amidase AmpD
MTETIMAARTHIPVSARERFMQQAQEEMSAFERREAEFRRKERANELRMPLNIDDAR